MSRFYLSLKNKPRVRIEFTEDLKDKLKPRFDEIFGVEFLSAETKKGNLLIYDFIPSIEDWNVIDQVLEKMAEDRIVESIKVDINMN
jgi:hypothetical protein